MTVTESIQRLAGRLGLADASHEESGIGLVLVVGITATLMIIMSVTMTVALGSLDSSHQHVSYEAELATAEAGLDETLGKIQAANDAGTTYVSPADCRGTWTWSASTTPTLSTERTWALNVMKNLPSSCLTKGGQGEYIAFRATDSTGHRVPVVYSMGWAPTRVGNENSGRLLKAEYLFSPYKPSEAVLTEATLDFSGSVEVDLATNSQATSADIHSNSDVVVGNNSLKVNGNVTAAGTNSLAGTCPIANRITGTCDSQSPPHTIPQVDARTIYRSLAKDTGQSWFDLCPNGQVRRPSTEDDNTTPCSGEEILSQGGTYRGWTFDASASPATWTFAATDGTDYPGVYYAYQADIALGGGGKNKTTVTMSAIAEAKPSGGPAETCGKYGGNLYWSHSNITNFLPGLVFLADGHIVATANADVGRGVIAAGDHIDYNTSSSTITGSVITSNRCAASGTNTMQGVKVLYDATSEVPLSTIVRTTQWLELAE